MRRLGLVSLLLPMTILGAVLAGLPIRPAAADPPAIEFTSDSILMLSEAETYVTIVNKSPVTWNLTIQATLFDKGKRVEVVVDDVKSSKLVDVLSFSLALPQGTSSGSGFVRVVGEFGNQRVVASREIAVKNSESPVPGITTWSGTSRPFLSQPSAREIPLTTDSCASIKAGEVGVVSGGDVGFIGYGCSAASGTGRAAVTLNTTDLTMPGEYVGTLKVGSTDVSITYLVARHWGFAVLALLLGFLCAAALQAWTNNRRPVTLVHNRLNELLRLAVVNQERYEAACNGYDYRSYNFVHAVAREVSRLQGELADAGPTGLRRLIAYVLPQPKDETDKILDSLSADIAILDRLVGGWPQLSRDCQRLAARCADLTQDERDYAPNLANQAESLLHPPAAPLVEVTLSSVAEVRKLRTAGALATVALNLVPRALQIADRLEMTQAGSQSDQDLLDEVTHNMNLIQAEFAEADAERVEEIRMDELLEAARRDLMRINPATRMETSSVDGAAGLPGIGLIARLPSLAERAYERLPRGTGASLFWLGVSLVVALWSGIYALYVGKPWGTAPDFIAAFVWAMVTTTVLAPVLTAAEGMMSGASRAPSSGEVKDAK